MKLKNLLELQPALQALASSRLPAVASYRIAKAVKAVGTELADYDAARIALCQKYGTLPEGGQEFQFTPEQMPLFHAELVQLLEEEVAVAFPRLAPSELGDLQIEPAHLMALDGVVLFDAP